MDFLEIDLDKNPQLRPSVLRKPTRVLFDVNNAEHCSAWLTFVQTGRWIILFEVELPALSVPATIERKLALKMASVTIQAARQNSPFKVQKNKLIDTVRTITARAPIETPKEIVETSIVGTPDETKVISIKQIRDRVNSFFTGAKLELVHDAKPAK